MKTNNEKGQGQIVILFLMLLAVVAVMVLALPTLTASKGLAEIAYDQALTNHALTAHQGQQWDATSIMSYFNDGKCKPTSYSCLDFDVHYCTVEDGKKSIGLVISTITNKVITGFKADTPYWQSRCK